MIYSFYSYKGGVGRTLTLIHTGIKLAAMRRQKGYTILLIDMDFNAPGFDAYFPSLKEGKIDGIAGFLIVEYKGHPFCYIMRDHV